jgi:hypothetical protein
MGTTMASNTGVRLSMKFNHSQQIRFAGWSENLDLGYADLPTAAGALPAIGALINDRVQCLGIGPILVEAVLAAYIQPTGPGIAPPRRATLSIPIPNQPPPGQAYNKAFSSADPAAQWTADFAEVVYYIRMETNLLGTPVYSRNYWLAGLPDIADSTDSAFITGAAAAALIAIKKYLGDLNNTNSTLGGQNFVSIRSMNQSAALLKQCTAWNVGPNSYTVPAHGFVVGQPVIAEGMRTAIGGTCPRGRYLVGSVIDASTITLQGSTPPTPPLKFGAFRAAVPVWNTCAVAFGNGFTKRNKGRPSGLAVGRRRKPSITRA